MKKNTKQLTKMLAGFLALASLTGCTTHYVNEKGEIIATSNNYNEVANVLTATGNLLQGAAAGAAAAADIVHEARSPHHGRHGGWYGPRGGYYAPAPAPVIVTPPAIIRQPVIVPPTVIPGRV